MHVTIISGKIFSVVSNVVGADIAPVVAGTEKESQPCQRQLWAQRF